jgi:hypothetical protein
MTDGNNWPNDLAMYQVGPAINNLFSAMLIPLSMAALATGTDLRLIMPSFSVSASD